MTTTNRIFFIAAGILAWFVLKDIFPKVATLALVAILLLVMLKIFKGKS